MSPDVAKCLSNVANQGGGVGVGGQIQATEYHYQKGKKTSLVLYPFKFLRDNTNLLTLAGSVYNLLTEENYTEESNF